MEGGGERRAFPTHLKKGREGLVVVLSEHGVGSPKLLNIGVVGIIVISQRCIVSLLNVLQARIAVVAVCLQRKI